MTKIRIVPLVLVLILLFALLGSSRDYKFHRFGRLWERMEDSGINLKTVLYYAQFEVDTESGYSTGRTTKEPGFDAIYYPQAVKNLQLRLRGNFPTDFAKDVDWNEYRFIVNYNF